MLLTICLCLVLLEITSCTSSFTRIWNAIGLEPVRRFSFVSGFQAWIWCKLFVSVFFREPAIYEHSLFWRISCDCFSYFERNLRSIAFLILCVWFSCTLVVLLCVYIISPYFLFFKMEYYLNWRSCICVIYRFALTADITIWLLRAGMIW